MLCHDLDDQVVGSWHGKGSEYEGIGQRGDGLGRKIHF